MIIHRLQIFLARSLIILLAVPALLFGCGGDEQVSVETGVQVELHDRIRFTHATDQAGLSAFLHETGAAGEMWFPETVGGGSGFLDYDGDGWLDIALVGGATWENNTTPAVWLFKNNGDGTFTDRTRETGLASVRAFGMGMAIADYDNDGDPDIFLANVGQNTLLQNQGDSAPTFVDVSEASGVHLQHEWSTSALFFDADLDGDNDLYVGNYVEWSPETDIRCTMDGESKAYCTPHLYQGVPGHFYRNDGDGTFSEATADAGFLPSPGKTLGIAEWDINQDGWPDVVVANDTQRDLLFLNNGDGTFNEQGVLSGIAFGDDGQARAGMGIDVGVVNDSGDPAIVIGHFSKEMIGFYQRTGGNLFVDRANQVQVGRASLPTLTFGLCLVDVDLDGWLDLFVGNGHIDASIERVEPGNTYKQDPQLFVNQANGRFSEYSSFIAAPMVARGVAKGDYDRDGDEDVLVTENGRGVHLLRNDRMMHQSVQIRLNGITVNRDALGADLTAVVGQRRMHHRVRTGSSYLVSSAKDVVFGLGDRDQVDTLLIQWPGRELEKVTGLQAGALYTIREGMGVTDSVPFAERSGAL